MHDLEAAMDILATGIAQCITELDAKREELATMKQSLEALRSRVRVAELHKELFGIAERRLDGELSSTAPRNGAHR